MKDAEAVTFAGGPLDRGPHLRGDAARRGSPPIPRRSASRSGRASRSSSPGRHPPRLAADGAPGLRRRRRRRRSSSASTTARPRFARGDPRLGGRRARRAPRPFLDDSRAAPPGLPESLAFGDLRAVMAELSADRRRHRRHRQGHPRLARDAPLLRQLRRAVRGRRRRLAARLPGLRRAALPAHRPGGHHADPARQLGAARPLAGLAAGDVLAARRLHGARRVDRGRRPPRGLRGGRRPGRARSTTSPASPGPSPPA